MLPIVSPSSVIVLATGGAHDVVGDEHECNAKQGRWVVGWCDSMKEEK
jgi:hypothetical protein